MFDVPEEWFEKGIDPESLSEHAVKADRWDQADLKRSASTVSEFEVARKTLEDFVDTGKPAMNDTFWSFLKARPNIKDEKEVKPSHLPNLRVQKQLRELAEYSHLRRFSIGDDVQAALSAAAVEPDLETLFDKTERSRKKAEELQQALQDLAAASVDAEMARRDLDELIEQWGGQPQDQDGDEDGDEDGSGDGDGQEADGDGAEGDGDGQGSGDGSDDADDGSEGAQNGKQGPQRGGGAAGGNSQGHDGPLTDEQQQGLNDAAKAIREAQEKLEEARERAEAASEGLNEMAEREAAEVRGILTQALNKAMDEARSLQGAAVAWGLDPGQLKRMPADERMDLARKLREERMKQIADLFGPIWNAFIAEQSRRTPDAHIDVTDVVLGDDLTLMLSSELILLDDEDGQWEFYRKYAERLLMQYEKDGEEKLARGAMICPIDASGSMMGDRELWAKAIMLCLLHHARIQHREMHVILFGSPNQYKTVSFKKPEDFTFERILDAAEPVFFGGTDFVTPMKESLRILEEEFSATGRVTADVVFITDDECWVDDEFMQFWLDEMERYQATTWGMNVSGYETRDGALARMTADPNHPTGKVATVKDFIGADDVRTIFRGV